jgi:3-hydroxybutyryl-CoA dehydrogenase
MKVVIAGEIPFIDEIGRLCRHTAHDTAIFLVEDFLGAIEAGYALETLAGAEIAIELHNESAAAKQELLLVLSDHLPPDALILTSALATSATQAASWVARPERVVGFGFVPPIAGGGLVELAAALQTSEAALSQAENCWARANRCCGRWAGAGASASGLLPDQ